jgi:hypothetical protein
MYNMYLIFNINYRMINHYEYLVILFYRISMNFTCIIEQNINFKVIFA